MTRHAPALLALSIVAVAGWTYNVNYDTRAAFDRLSVLRAEIAEERETLQVLRVEWAYLNAPERLAGLVAAHNEALGLTPLVPEDLAIAAAVPYPPREAPDAAPPGAPAAAGPSPSATQAVLRPPQASAETVPDALEAAIAAALVEVGATPDGSGRSAAARAGTSPPVISVAANGVPLPSARPAPWSDR